MKLFSMAVCAASASIACSAFAAPAFQTESFGSDLWPIRLFNDGQMLTRGPTSYGPNTCPVAQRPDQTYCNPPILKETLALATVAGGFTVLPFDIRGAGYRFNPDGKGVIWTGYEGLNLQAADVYTGTAAPFAPGAASPWAACTGIEPYTEYLWQDFTATGKLLGQNTACARPDSVYFFSPSGTQEIAAPANYSGVRVAGVNKAEQLAVTAIQPSSTPANKAFLWTPSGGYKALPVPLLSWLLGYAYSEAVAIDDGGNVLGNLYKRDGGRHAVIWQGSKTVDIGTLSGYKSSMAVGLSSTGVALLCAYDEAGSTGTSPAPQLFFWVNGTKLAWSSAVTPRDGKAAPSSCAGLISGGASKLRFLPNGKGQWLLQNEGTSYLVSPTN